LRKSKYGKKSNFVTTEIFLNDEGKETKLTWDYRDRFPTEKEKQATRQWVTDENKRNRLNAEAKKINKKVDKL
jgi:hypothetical protein|tara:strand:+ start:251 stop:469 length:219 start_codon:yes stop_codon:yes gene_type:complete